MGARGNHYGLPGNPGGPSVIVETYTIPGPYSLATGQRLPDEKHTRESLGVARIVRQRTATFPSRVCSYFDWRPWGGGLTRAQHAGPGAFVIDSKAGIMGDLQTGAVYSDSRFVDKGQAA